MASGRSGSLLTPNIILGRHVCADHWIGTVCFNGHRDFILYSFQLPTVTVCFLPKYSVHKSNVSMLWRFVVLASYNHGFSFVVPVGASSSTSAGPFSGTIKTSISA